MAKAAPKLSIRNFIPVTTSGMDKKDPAMSMTLAVNRLGHTVTDVGKILTSGHQARLDAAYAVQGRRSLAQDRARESKIEKKATEEIERESKSRGYSKGGSGIFGFLSPLIEPLIKFAATLGTFFALDWLSKKENKESIRTGFEWIGKWLGTVWKVGSWGFGMIYDGLFDPDGNDSYLMRALKVVGGIAALKVASRILMPWKLAGDIGKLSKLFKVNRTKATKNAKKVNQNNFLKQKPKRVAKGIRSGNASKAARKRYARRFGGNASKSRFGGRIAGRAGSKGMTGMGRFVRSGAGGGIFAGALSFGSRLAAGDKMNVAAGGGIGATIGTVAVTALLTPVLGPFAPIVGGVLGGFFGDKIGAFLGEAIEPVLKPLGDYFKNIALPMFNAFVKPVATAIQNLFEPLKHVLDMVLEFIAPIAGAAFQGLMDYVIGPAAKAALDSIVWIFEKAIWAINNVGGFIKGTGNTLTRVIGSDGQKAMAQVENEDYDVKRLKAELKVIRERIANGEGGSRSAWFGVDGVFKTSNGAPGMTIMNGHWNGLGSTNEEKAKHWENVLIPFAEEKAASAKAALAQFEMAQPQTSMVDDPFVSKKGIGTDDSPVPKGGRIDFQGHGDGATGVLRLFDGKNRKIGQWEAISGQYSTAGTSQSQRRNVSGALYPLPDGKYPLVGFAEHSNVSGIGTWSTFINNMGGVIGKRSAIQLHNDINDNGTAGCVGVTLGGTAGNNKDKDFVKKYKQVMPETIRVSIAKGAKQLSTGPSPSPDNREIRPTDLNSTKTSELTRSSQQQDTELSSGDGSSMVVFQPIIKPVVSETGVIGVQTVTKSGDFSLTGLNS